AQSPDAVAVVFEPSAVSPQLSAFSTHYATRTTQHATPNTQHLTYRELNRRANQLAHHLRGLGVGPDVLVGICMDRSLELVVGILGILKAGGAYVPLDPAYPPERLAFMLEDSGAAVLLTQTALDDGRWTMDDRVQSDTVIVYRLSSIVYLDADWPVIAQQPETSLDSGVTPDHLAYIIYTSGSTGTPKGVHIPHGAVVNFLHSMRQQMALVSQDILLAVTTLSFDIAVLEF